MAKTRKTAVKTVKPRKAATPQPTLMVDPQAVAELLARSWAAHDEAKRVKASGDRAGWLVLLKDAREARRMAAGMDPQFTAGAWQSEQGKTPHGKDTHTEMCRFYDHQIARGR